MICTINLMPDTFRVKWRTLFSTFRPYLLQETLETGLKKSQDVKYVLPCLNPSKTIIKHLSAAFTAFLYKNSGGMFYCV